MITSNTNLYWIGPRLSDISGIESVFKGAIVLSGALKKNSIINYCLEHETRHRINVNSQNNTKIIKNFYLTSINKILDKDSNAKFVWYSPPIFDITTRVIDHSPYMNSPVLHRTLSNKFRMRMALSDRINVVPTRQILESDVNFKNLKATFPGYSEFVIQDNIGSGGYKTFILTAGKQPKKNKENSVVNASPYISNGLPINQHSLISSNSINTLHPSIQVIENINGALMYAGCDYSLSSQLIEAYLENIHEAGRLISSYCQSLGYKGVLGIDSLLMPSGEVVFLEINPRFQGSTSALNQAYIKEGCSSVQEMHIDCFEGRDSSIPDVISPFSAYSFINKTNGYTSLKISDFKSNIRTPDPRESEFNTDSLWCEISTDGFSDLQTHEEGSPSHRYLIDRPIATLNTNNKINLLPVFRMNKRGYLSAIERGNINSVARFKFDLLSYGIRLSNKVLSLLLDNDKTITLRDGIAGGIELRFFKDIYVNTPFKESFSFLSPFELDWSKKDQFHVKHLEVTLALCDVMPLPSFSGKKLSSGTKHEDIGQIFTDRLGVYPFRSCAYNSRNQKACKFCEIGYQTPLAPVPISELTELVGDCLKNKADNMRHILISGGVPSKRRWQYLSEVATAIRKMTDISIYQMLEPPDNVEDLKLLKEAGINEIGFNVEIFNRDVAKKIMPGKGAIPYDKYKEAMLYARKLWPEPGAVRSLLIVGLEPMADTLKGVRSLTSMGVMPILSPFRPVPGTELEHHTPPSGDDMYEVWELAQEICVQNNITLGPTCVACQNNTITIPVNEWYRHY